VVVSHYIPINVAVGWATADDRVECAAPDHASVTVLEVADGRARLLERGREGTGAAL
jgi:hypothetical protein